MPMLVANKDLRYASRDLKAGERFDASEKDAEILKAVGHADHADESAVDGNDGSAVQPRRKSRTYQRRDLLAEGSEGAE